MGPLCARGSQENKLLCDRCSTLPTGMSDQFNFFFFDDLLNEVLNVWK